MKHRAYVAYALSAMILASALAIMPKAYGHGLGGDIAPAVSFAGQNVTVETRLTPSDLALFNLEEGVRPLISVRFFDADLNQNIPEVTMRVTIEKDNKILLNGWFYDPSGEIKFEVNPVERENFVIYGEVEPQLGAYYNRGAPIRVDGPIFTDGGLYRISTEIRSAYTTKQLLDVPLKFDTWVSVAEDDMFNVSVAEQEYPITIRTYYDTVEKLAYNPDSNALTFEMPFNWDEQYISLVPLVHEEIIMPKDLPVAASGQFDGYVNDIKVGGRAILVDPYTYEDKLIAHFILNTQTLQDLRQQLATDGEVPDKMTFRLVPKESTNGEEGFQTVQFMADNGKVKVIAQWPEEGIFPQQESEIRLTFFNADTTSLLRDIRYNIKFFDENGDVILEQDRYTPEGIDVIRHTFDREGMVTMQVNIIGTGFSVQRIDTSVAGTAETSIAVVPEFPVAVLIIGIGMIAAIAMLRRQNTLIRI